VTQAGLGLEFDPVPFVDLAQTSWDEDLDWLTNQLESAVVGQILEPRIQEHDPTRTIDQRDSVREGIHEPARLLLEVDLQLVRGLGVSQDPHLSAAGL
jgi:hypothetical protein